ncbi:hypothetical protein DUHN55_10220 [Helicobacter pylori]
MTHTQEIDMPIIDVTTDLDTRTLVMTTEFPVSVERLWQVWADPRQLEQWWGPEGYPATVTEHDLTPGGTVSYHMTSPEGEKFPGGWTVVAVEEPRRLELRDYFADADGNPVDSAPHVDDGRRVRRRRRRCSDGQHLDVGVRRRHAEGARHGRRRGLEVRRQPARQAARRLSAADVSPTVGPGDP